MFLVLGVHVIQLLIGNSYSKLTNLSYSQEKDIKKALSYTVDLNSQYYGGFGPTKKSLLSKRGEFPTGVLGRVLMSLQKFEHNVVDTRVIPTGVKKSIQTKYPLYEAQIKAVASGLKHHRGTISMPTGTGKTLVISLLAGSLNVSTLVIVPSLEIKQQLTMSLLETLGANHKITVENIDSSTLKHQGNFQCLIIDEAHHSAAKTYQRLNKLYWNNIYYRFFLTATPFRNNKEETLLFEAIAGEVIYKLDYKTAISKGYIVPVEAYYIEVPKQNTDAYTWAEVYKELVVNNEIRNIMIANLLANLEGLSTLCLVKEIAHGDNLVDITALPFANGQTEGSSDLIKEFNKSEIDRLIGTSGILGEGVDTKPCEYVIIAGLGKAKSQFMQQVGRAVRKFRTKESAKIILIKDTSHKFTLRHFKEQCKILKEEYGVVPLKI